MRPEFRTSYSADEIPAELPQDWVPGKHPQIQWAQVGVGIDFIPLEDLGL